MTTITTTHPRSSRTTERTQPKRDTIARVILGVCAVGATAAAAATAGEVADADGAHRVAETWRMAGLPVFAGLFALLAVAPRRLAGLWELVLVNKLVLVGAGATFLSDLDGGREFVAVDGLLVILLASAYVLARGWTAWSAR